MRQWLQHVAQPSQHAPDGATLSRGCIGEPSGAYEVDLAFGDLTALQRFWDSLEGPEQRAWMRQAEVRPTAVTTTLSRSVAVAKRSCREA